MDFRELTREDYDRKLRTVIVGAEGLHARVQDVGDGRATIGWGYTLNRNNNVDIWLRSGVELTAAQLAALDRIDQAPAARKTAIGLTFDRVLTEAESDRLFRASLHEYEAPATRAGMPLSDERIAIVSVSYNRGPAALRDHPLMDAIVDGDRAEAWYQLRYNCWGSQADMEGGLRKRRFAEAEVFGLYDDPDNISPEEARDVYRMYRSRFAEIDRVERAFGVAIDGTEARPNRIAQANRDYPSLVAEYGAVQTIDEALAPARAAMLEHLRQRYPQQAVELTEERFNSARIDLEQFAPVVGSEALRNRQASEAVEARPRDVQSGVGRAEAFDDAGLAQLFAAISSGDATEAHRGYLALASSPSGASFLAHGEELLSRGAHAPESRASAIGHEHGGLPRQG